MKDKKKAMEWLVVFIILIVMFVLAGTYAFLNIKQYYKGTFEVSIQSKGVDVFVIDKTNDVNLLLNEYNFSRGLGHNITGDTSLIPTLETSNKKTKVCYTVNVSLPQNQVFSYSNGTNPELVLDVFYSNDGINYSKIINNMDITTKTGNINIPISANSTVYKHEIETTKHVKKKKYYKAQITFIYYERIDQSINNEKTYTASINANVVEC